MLQLYNIYQLVRLKCFSKNVNQLASSAIGTVKCTQIKLKIKLKLVALLG